MRRGIPSSYLRRSGGLWLLTPPSPPGFLQMQLPREPELFVGLGGTERRECGAWGSKGAWPRTLPPPAPFPPPLLQPLICYPEELLGCPQPPSAPPEEGERGKDAENSEAESGRWAFGAGPWALSLGLLGISGLHGSPLPCSEASSHPHLPRVRGCLREEVAATSCLAWTPRPSSRKSLTPRGTTSSREGTRNS